MRIIVLTVLLVISPPAFGQYLPYNPYAPVIIVPPPPPPGPREKRAARDAAVQRVGPEARSLVETYGEAAVEALNSVSLPVGRMLAECHNSGDLMKVARPYSVLRAMATPDSRDDVALFVIERIHDLSDAAVCEAFLTDPLAFSLGLKDLSASVERASIPILLLSKLPEGVDGRMLAGGAAVVGIVLLLRWRQCLRA